MKLDGAFKGFESIYLSFIMLFKMIIKLIVFSAILQILISGSIIYFNHEKLFGKFDEMDICLIRTYYLSKVKYNISPIKSKVMIDYKCETPNSEISYDRFIGTFGKYINQRIQKVQDKCSSILLWTSLVYLLVPLLIIIFYRRHKKEIQDKFIRGSMLVPSENMSNLINSASPNEVKFKISNNVSMPLSITSRHSFIIGKPGSGKTQLIGRILDQILKHNYRIIIHDFKGDFISTYFNFKKHYIFNPLDKRHMGLKDIEMQLINEMNKVSIEDINESARIKYQKQLRGKPLNSKICECFSFTELLDYIVDINSNISDKSKYISLKIDFNITKNIKKGWSIFNELQSPVDIDAFCASLIPESASSDNFWPISSRQLLGSIITYCMIKGKTSYDELWKMVNKSNEELLECFKKTGGCEEGVKLLTEAKTANNILAVMSNYTKPIKYLRGTDGSFSIKEWIKDNDSEKRVIFLSNYAMIQETIKPFLTLFVDFSTKTLCSMDDDLNRRLFFILDEFGQLSKIGSIIQLLTQSRSKGGASFILIQDVAQINSIYGKEGATSIVNSCGNTISFAVSDESTADFISKKIGSMEIKRTEESNSLGLKDFGGSISTSHQTTEKRVVMPSEVMTIPTMNCFIQLTDYPVTKDKLDFMQFPKNTESYIGREDLLIIKGKPNSENSGASPTLSNFDEKAALNTETASQKVPDELFEESNGLSKKEKDFGELQPRAVKSDSNKALRPFQNDTDLNDQEGLLI